MRHRRKRKKQARQERNGDYVRLPGGEWVKKPKRCSRKLKKWKRYKVSVT